MAVKVESMMAPDDRLDGMTRDERGLLLHLETRLVDWNGRVDTRRMNDADMVIVKQWASERFIQFGRIAFHDIVNKLGTHWVSFSSAAWEVARLERKRRAERCEERSKYGRIGFKAWS